MNKIFLTFILILIIKFGYAQQDSTLNLPIRNGKLIYSDSISIQGKSKSKLDSTAKTWMKSSLKHFTSKELDKKDTSTVKKGQLEFKMAPYQTAMVKHSFYVDIDVKIECKDNFYSYSIFNLYIHPGSNFFSSGYKGSAESFINLYNSKNMGLTRAMNLGRKKVKEFIILTNDVVLACIESLNKAMAN